MYNFIISTDLIEKTIKLIGTPKLKEIHQAARKYMLSEKIDPTAFIVWFIENYPDSFQIMKDNPDFQYLFK